jgi:hypothetical protein
MCLIDRRRPLKSISVLFDARPTEFPGNMSREPFRANQGGMANGFPLDAMVEEFCFFIGCAVRGL